MIDPKLAKLAEQIEIYIRESTLAKSYSALPGNSYHMTIYSIYQCGNRLIPPVERWVNASGYTISKHAWLPKKVLQEQNNKAMCILEKYLAEPLYIKYATLNVGKKYIKLILKADEESMQRIRNTREELKKIYEHPDLSMEPIGDRLHITLAYVYASMGNINVEEWNELNRLTRQFNGAKLLYPSVYLFESMERYIPYEKGIDSNCDTLIE